MQKDRTHCQCSKHSADQKQGGNKAKHSRGKHKGSIQTRQHEHIHILLPVALSPSLILAMLLATVISTEAAERIVWLPEGKDQMKVHKPRKKRRNKSKSQSLHVKVFLSQLYIVLFLLIMTDNTKSSFKLSTWVCHICTFYLWDIFASSRACMLQSNFTSSSSKKQLLVFITISTPVTFSPFDTTE